MIRLVVAPSALTSSVRVSASGRSTMLNCALPAAWRWLISSATGSVALTM